MNNQRQPSDKLPARLQFHVNSESFTGNWNKLKSIVTVLIFSSLLFSCNTSNKDQDTTSGDLQKEMEDVVDVSKKYGAEKWDNLSDNIEELEKDIEASTNQVIDNYKNLSADLQNQFKDEKQDIADRRAELKKKLEEFQKASGKEKEKLKKEIIQLRTALSKSVSAFEKEMEENQE